GIALRLRDLLLLGKLDELGRTLHEAWQIKRRFSPLISNQAIDELYQIGLKAGALGGKILGAGGGGYLLFLCAYDRRHHVAEKLKGVGAEVSSVSFEPQGVQIWEAPNLEESHRKGS
ncbi:MAG: hypothetical protein Q8O40_13980, partial [Chloroflexota bacterium]|nr:hypothetical protein [Chloroflexota bacterium]